MIRDILEGEGANININDIQVVHSFSNQTIIALAIVFIVPVLINSIFNKVT